MMLLLVGRKVCFVFVFGEEYAPEPGGWLVLAAFVGSLLGDFVVSVLASVLYHLLTDVFKQQHTYPTDVCSSH